MYRLPFEASLTNNWSVSGTIFWTKTCSSSCSPNGPQSLAAAWLKHGSTASNDTILKDASGVEPGCVEIIPLKRVTRQLRTWLYSQQTETRYFSDKVTWKKNRWFLSTIKLFCWYLIRTFVTGLWWTVNVWKSCGPCPTVSGCWTITLTDPDLVP